MTASATLRPTGSGSPCPCPLPDGQPGHLAVTEADDTPGVAGLEVQRYVDHGVVADLAGERLAGPLEAAEHPGHVRMPCSGAR